MSPRTCQFYRGYLSKFMKALQGPVLFSTKAHLMEFLESLTCAPGGKHAYFRAIRAFYRWAIEEEYIEKSPVDRMKAPKVPQPLRPAVSLDSLPRLLSAAESASDKLIISLLADTGVRRAELAAIRERDIDLEARTIKIHGKGAKERLVAYGPQTASLLADYLPEVKDERLLPLGVWGIRSMLKRLESKTGIKCNPHTFRRTFACESIRNGLNVFYVQSLLGHSTLAMTRIYAEQVNSEDTIKAYKPIVR